MEIVMDFDDVDDKTSTVCDWCGKWFETWDFVITDDYEDITFDCPYCLNKYRICNGERIAERKREYTIYWTANYGKEWGDDWEELDDYWSEDGKTCVTLPPNIEMDADIAFDILTQGSPHTNVFEGWAPIEVYNYYWE
ncbi:hypothetical protein ACFLZE_00425 [Thermodesulfobacteriota bacterium]